VFLFGKELRNVPNIKEVKDGGVNPNTPSVKQMRESQQRGASCRGQAPVFTLT